MGDSFGGRQASPPTLDTAQSQKLTQADYDLKQKNTPGLVETTGKAGREEYARTMSFALQGLADPSSIFKYDLEDAGKKISETNKKIADMGSWQQSSDGRRYNPTANKWVSKEDYQKQLAGLNTTLKRQTSNRANVAKMARDPVGTLKRTFGKEFGMRDDLLKDMQRAERSSKEYTRMQRALQKGLTAQQVGQRSAKAAQARAAGMGQVADVTAGQVGAGALGDTLMSQAMERAQSRGQLSAEASRDAVQAARSGMAARGMATGSAGMAAEMLNRDRFSRARMAEDLAFAQGVQGQDLSRQFNNVGNTLQADLANQQTQFGREQIISGNLQQARLANMQAMNNMRQFNVGLAADTDRFNAAQRTDAQRFNVGMLQSSALAADNERARQLGLGQTAYNFALQTNPKLMLAGLGEPYANFTPQALGLMNNTNVQPIYSGGQLGSPGVFQTIMSTAGQFAQAGGQAYAAASDRRMKKDIKQVGKDNVLGLKTYEYRFKGESKDTPKHRGYMAQEVQKVLPEAVTEFNYKGKKRLAIKPAVIGQAVAEMLAEQQKSMFADGYVVGAGLGD